MALQLQKLQKATISFFQLKRNQVFVLSLGIALLKIQSCKAAVIHEELHVGYAFFVVPSDPTSLEVIWTPYTKLLETIKEQSR